MSDSNVVVNDAPVVITKTPKAKKVGGVKKAKKSIHYSELIIKAIFNIHDRTGSSLQAIEKYILSNNPSIDRVQLHKQCKVQIRRLAANNKIVRKKASYFLSSFSRGKLTRNPKKLTKSTTTKSKSVGKTKKSETSKSTSKAKKVTKTTKTSKVKSKPRTVKPKEAKAAPKTRIATKKAAPKTRIATKKAAPKTRTATKKAAPKTRTATKKATPKTRNATKKAAPKAKTAIKSKTGGKAKTTPKTKSVKVKTAAKQKVTKQTVKKITK